MDTCFHAPCGCGQIWALDVGLPTIWKDSPECRLSPGHGLPLDCVQSMWACDCLYVAIGGRRAATLEVPIKTSGTRVQGAGSKALLLWV